MGRSSTTSGGLRISGWKLDRDQRKELLQQFPARYANIIADHVTLAVKPPPDAAELEPVVGEIVGRADDGQGVEAMVVSLHGSTERPDGGTFHITWSLGDGRRAKESNDVILAHGWERFDLPMPVQLSPSLWP